MYYKTYHLDNTYQPDMRYKTYQSYMRYLSDNTYHLDMTYKTYQAYKTYQTYKTYRNGQEEKFTGGWATKRASAQSDGKCTIGGQADGQAFGRISKLAYRLATTHAFFFLYIEGNYLYIGKPFAYVLFLLYI